MPDTFMNTTADEQVVDGLVLKQIILREKDPAFRVLREMGLAALVSGASRSGSL